MVNTQEIYRFGLAQVAFKGLWFTYQLQSTT